MTDSLHSALEEVLSNFRALVVLSNVDRQAIVSAYFALGRHCVATHADEIAVLITDQVLQHESEFVAHAPGNPDKNSAFFVHTIETSLFQTLRSVVRMDAGLIMIDALMTPDALSLCLMAAETGHRLVIADHSGDAKTAIESLYQLASASERASIDQQLLPAMLKSFMVMGDNGAWQAADPSA